MKNFIKKYWKKHLIVIGISVILMNLSIYSGFSQLIFLTIISQIAAGYIIMRDIIKYYKTKNKGEKLK